MDIKAKAASAAKSGCGWYRPILVSLCGGKD